jgi:hypothetical protein
LVWGEYTADIQFALESDSGNFCLSILKLFQPDLKFRRVNGITVDGLIQAAVRFAKTLVRCVNKWFPISVHPAKLLDLISG